MYMLITRFNKPIVFRVDSDFFYDTELVLRKWTETDISRNMLYVRKMYDKVFPLVEKELYIFNAKWANPIQIFGSKYDLSMYNWIYISGAENVLDFDALLRLHVNSSIDRNCVQDPEKVKIQMLNGDEYITVFTI